MRALAMIACVALVAIAMPAIILPIGGPEGAARVVFLDMPDLSLLPEGLTIDRWNGRQAVLAGVDARAARSLYALGAIFVYPVRTNGCLALSPAKRAAKLQ